MNVTILGCGTSAGVPRIGNDWGDCDPLNPRNRRSRVSILITHGNQRILVDTSPDLRQQFLDNEIALVDAVIWTHDHADHCHGIDDLRAVCHASGATIPGYGRLYTMDSLKRRFGYVFAGNKGYPSLVNSHLLKDQDYICDLEVIAVDQPHGPVKSTGLRFNSGDASIVYATDFSEITPQMVAAYAGCELLIVDCLRKEQHPTHAHFDMSMDLAKRTCAKSVILTHLDKSMDYAGLSAELPPHIAVGFDGQSVEIASI